MTSTKGTPCSDGLFCNGEETCDGNGECVSPGNPCINMGICHSACDEINDRCVPNQAGNTQHTPCLIMIQGHHAMMVYSVMGKILVMGKDSVFIAETLVSTTQFAIPDAKEPVVLILQARVAMMVWNATEKVLNICRSSHFNRQMQWARCVRTFYEQLWNIYFIYFCFHTYIYFFQCYCYVCCYNYSCNCHINY